MYYQPGTIIMLSGWINEVFVFLVLNALLSYHLSKAKSSADSPKEERISSKKGSKSTKETESTL
jgi:hypothetical protein